MLKKSLLLMFTLGAFNNLSFAASDLENCQNLVKNHEYEKALAPCQAAAEQGNSEAQYNIGYMYAEGFGVEQDIRKGIDWYQKSADQGYADAQFSLAWSHIALSGVFDSKDDLSDYEQAFDLFKKAAKQGHSGAHDFLGSMYKDGEGVKQDYQLAYMWYWQAAQKDKESYADELNEIAEKLTPEQLAQAKKMAEECAVSNYKNCAE